MAECRNRFPSAEFEVGNGKDIAMIPSGTVDAIWSFDVFVHINAAEFSSYVEEFRRVLKPGGLVRILRAKVENVEKLPCEVGATPLAAIPLPKHLRRLVPGGGAITAR